MKELQKEIRESTISSGMYLHCMYNSVIMSTMQCLTVVLYFAPAAFKLIKPSWSTNKNHAKNSY